MGIEGGGKKPRSHSSTQSSNDLVPRREIKGKRRTRKEGTEREWPFGRSMGVGKRKSRGSSRPTFTWHTRYRYFLLPMSSRHSKGDTGIRRAQRMPTLRWRARLLVSHAANFASLYNEPLPRYRVGPAVNGIIKKSFR